MQDMAAIFPIVCRNGKAYKAFMLTLVINLDRAAERREAIATRLNQLGVPFEFFRATDGRNLNEAERRNVDDARRRRYSRFPLTGNEIACGLSHVRAMQQMLDKNLPVAAILEDDAVLTDEFGDVLKALETGGDFDFVFLQTPTKRGRKRAFVPLQKITGQNALGRVKYMNMRATGYVVSRKGAEKFLVQAQPFVHAIDMAMHRYWENGLDIYGLQNPVVGHDDAAPSTINEVAGNRPKNPAYPDADTLQWRFIRTWVKFLSGLRKRLVFHTRLV
jgi:glycosyl transferase, family 25